ncbi:MAG: Cell division protein ZapD, partial [uncultured Ramlibacter sp.]
DPLRIPVQRTHPHLPAPGAPVPPSGPVGSARAPGGPSLRPG